MYDLIGDIHGHADELRRLLDLLGYRRAGGAYSHPDRQAVFLGDFIDRGPRIREVLHLVQAMTTGGHALAVMGNHEWNALAYHTPDPAAPGEYLRRHEPKNVRQHSQTLRQVPLPELADHLDWFRTLPLWLDLPGLRAVHACWDEASVAAVQRGFDRFGGLTDGFLEAGSRKAGDLFGSVETLLKGKEMALPAGVTYRDKDGHVRATSRTRWYLPAAGHTLRSYAMQSDGFDTDAELAEEVVGRASPYPPGAKPVFVGHYWLWADAPEVLAPNVACLDYSVAKGGALVAYRWDGEAELRNDKFAWVRAASG